MTTGIYKIISPTGRIYIGQSVNIERRFSAYKGMNCRQQTKLYYSLLKHGVDQHEFSVLEVCDQDCLDQLESYYIEKFNTFNSRHGLNLQSGGYGGKHSDESRQKISASRIGMVFSDETRLKMSEKRKALNLKPSLGKVCSAETKLKLSAINKGKKLSQESIEKRTATRKKRMSCVGLRHSSETKIKMSISMKVAIKSRNSAGSLYKTQ